MTAAETFILGLVVGVLVGHALGWRACRRREYNVLRGRR